MLLCLLLGVVVFSAVAEAALTYASYDQMVSKVDRVRCYYSRDYISLRWLQTEKQS